MNTHVWLLWDIISTVQDELSTCVVLRLLERLVWKDSRDVLASLLCEASLAYGFGDTLTRLIQRVTHVCKIVIILTTADHATTYMSLFYLAGVKVLLRVVCKCSLHVTNSRFPSLL